MSVTVPKLARESFHNLASAMGTKAVQSLREACLNDDVKLIQGQSTLPAPLQCVKNWPCEGACAIGYPVWQVNDLEFVSDIEEAFARTCFEADQLAGEPAHCRWFLNWFDDTPRPEALAGTAQMCDKWLQTNE